MIHTLTEEQAALRDLLRQVVKDAAPIEHVAALADASVCIDDPLWRKLITELGVGGLLIPVKWGGAGASWGDVSCVLGELGRALAMVPFASSCVVSATMLLASGDDSACQELLPDVASGRRVATVAIADRDGGIDTAGRVVSASRTEGGELLDGRRHYVIDGMFADVLLVYAHDENGPAWFIVESESVGVTVERMTILDATRPMAVVTFAGAPARRLVGQPAAPTVLQRTLDAATLALACEQTTASEYLLGLAVEYAQTRYQFGQPIGSFQAVQHRLADVALVVDQAKSALEHAVWAVGLSPDKGCEAIAIAGTVCSESMCIAAEEAIHIHGGIGFTWEHQAHRYYRRAVAGMTLYGTPDDHRQRLLDAVGLSGTIGVPA